MRKLLFYIWNLLRGFFFKPKQHKLSKGEAFVKAWLDINNLKYIPQYHVSVPKNIRPSGNCYVDFMVIRNKKKFVIEYNGRQHYEFVPKFHRSKADFDAQLVRDAYIKTWCDKEDITFIEIPYSWKTDQIISKLKELL